LWSGCGYCESNRSRSAVGSSKPAMQRTATLRASARHGNAPSSLRSGCHNVAVGWQNPACPKDAHKIRSTMCLAGDPACGTSSPSAVTLCSSRRAGCCSRLLGAVWWRFVAWKAAAACLEDHFDAVVLCHALNAEEVKAAYRQLSECVAPPHIVRLRLDESVGYTRWRSYIACSRLRHLFQEQHSSSSHDPELVERDRFLPAV
jgi:hypothetical protein